VIDLAAAAAAAAAAEGLVGDGGGLSSIGGGGYGSEGGGPVDPGRCIIVGGDRQRVRPPRRLVVVDLGAPVELLE
jgi:hypothetical protein